MHPCRICGHPRDEHTKSFCWHEGCEVRHAYDPGEDFTERIRPGD